MNELLYPTITGIVGGLITVIFEYYFVQPIKDKSNSGYKISYSLTFFLLVSAGVILIELILHFFFPSINDNKKPLIKFFSDVNISFAALFYVLIILIAVFHKTKSNIIRLIFFHLIPCIMSALWVYKYFYGKGTNLYYPIFLSIIFAWLFSSLTLFFNYKVRLVTAILFFPLIAIIANTEIVTKEAWLLSFLTCFGMIGMSASYEDFLSERKKDFSFNQNISKK